MNKSVIVIALALSIISLPAQAQVEKQVEVTKSYIPEIEKATKLRLKPDMVDTMQMRPDIDYSITPRSVETSLSSRIYKPASVTYWELGRPKRAYIKGGIGYPFASLADFYVSKFNPNDNYVVGYINHRGEYGKVTNDYKQKVSALNSQNRVGVASGVMLLERMLEGEVYYDLDAWSRSATSHPSNGRPIYQNVSIAGRIGDDFINLSTFNYNISVNANHFFNSKGDSNTAAGAAAKFGRETRRGAFVSEIGYDYIMGSGSYVNNSLSLQAAYLFDIGNWNWSLGLKYHYDVVSTDMYRNSMNYMFPQIDIKNSANRKIQPFVKFDSRLNRNNYGALTSINPYIAEGETLDVNNIEYMIKGGIQGSLFRNNFSYNLHANYNISPNALYWTLHENEVSAGHYDNYYKVGVVEIREFSACVDLVYRMLGNLTLKGGGSIHKYITPNSSITALSRPKLTAYIVGEYTHKKMSCGITADVKGSSYTSKIVTSLNPLDSSNSEVKVSTAVNLKAFAEYAIKSDLVVFVEANNLTNSKQYSWMGYREYGVNAMAGVKMQF